MKRSTLDRFFVAGGLLLAVLLGTLGFVLKSNADFANDYVHDQLGQQKISFTPAKFLAADENAPCLKTYAGKLLSSGKQAECYANKYIGVHLTHINDGKTYSETSGQARAEGLDEKTKAELEGKADTLFKGESLRGLLLTSYGFSEFGRKADQAATVAFLAALVLLLASLAGAVHAMRTPPTKVIE